MAGESDVWYGKAMDLKVNKRSAVTWEIDRGDVEFQIRLLEGAYVIDVFDRTSVDPHASLASYAGHTWSCVESYVLNFNPTSAFPEPGYGDDHGYVLVE